MFRMRNHFLPLLALALLPAVCQAQGQELPEDKVLRAQRLLDQLAKEQARASSQRDFLADHYFKTGRKLYDQMRFERARLSFEQALKLKPDHEEAARYLARVRNLLRPANPGPAEVLTQVAAERSARRQLMLIELRHAMAQAREAQRALKYDQAIDGYRRTLDLARLLSHEQDVSAIVANAQACIAKLEHQQKDHVAHEQALKRKRAAAYAEEVRRKRDALYQRRIERLFTLARKFVQERRYRDAVRACNSILILEPQNAAAEALRAAVLDRQRVAARAKTARDRVVETQRVWEGLRSRSVPQYAVLEYPENWDEIKAQRAPGLLKGAEQEEPWVAELKGALQRRVSFDFVETPLEDVVSFIQSIADINIILDTAALAAKPHAQAPITLKVTDMRLESALDWIVKLSELTYVFQDEAIFISDRTGVDPHPQVRIYDVTDLVTTVRDFPGRGSALRGEETLFAEEENDRDRKGLSGDDLVEMLKSVVEPKTWSRPDREIKLLGRSKLVVR